MKRGEVWLVDFAPQVGTEITKQRPAVIVSVNGITAFPTRLVVPFRERKASHSSIVYFVAMQPSIKQWFDQRKHGGLCTDEIS
jgi:mRNA interferase MazF